MQYKKKKSCEWVGACLGLVLAGAFAGNALADDPPGSRYAMERYYHSEISAAKAYLLINRNDDNRSNFGNAKGGTPTFLIDVRKLSEYAAGHPKRAYNVPFPHIVSSYDQDPQLLYDEVYSIVDGDLDARILTLCRSGFRSVLAANILAKPEAFGVAGDKFTNVRNIWEGFLGNYKTAASHPYDPFTVNPNHADFGVTLEQHEADHDHILLDLNNNGILDNGDKDGWANFQELPWTTLIVPHRAYLEDVGLYD